MSTPAEVKPYTLNETIERLLEDMSQVNTESPEYAIMCARVQELYPLKEIDTKSKTSKWTSPELLAPILANLAGIAMIVGHERAHVLGSKALGFIMKLK